MSNRIHNICRSPRQWRKKAIDKHFKAAIKRYGYIADYSALYHASASFLNCSREGWCM